MDRSSALRHRNPSRRLGQAGRRIALVQLTDIDGLLQLGFRVPKTRGERQYAFKELGIRIFDLQLKAELPFVDGGILQIILRLTKEGVQ